MWVDAVRRETMSVNVVVSIDLDRPRVISVNASETDDFFAVVEFIQANTYPRDDLNTTYFI